MKNSKFFLTTLFAAAAMGTSAYATSLTDATLFIDSFDSETIDSITDLGWNLSGISGTESGIFTSTSTQATISAGTSGASLTTTSSSGNRKTFSAILTVDKSVFSKSSSTLLVGGGTIGVGTNGTGQMSNLQGYYLQSGSMSAWGSGPKIESVANYANDDLVTIGIVFGGGNTGTTIYVFDPDTGALVSNNLAGLRDANSTSQISLAGIDGVEYSNLYWFNSELNADDMTSAMSIVATGTDTSST
ncbi:MAG: hypothetical protein ACI4V1_10705, partial [Eubacteriales bacterium]